jgi:hypothetical protein
MENQIVHNIYRLCLILLFCGLLTGISRADTFHLTDGSTVTGDIVSMDEKGVVLKQPDGSYGDRLSWTKVSQADLKTLQQDPKAAQYVEPFIDQPTDDRAQRTQIEVKEVPHLDRPGKHSLLGALFTSGMGLFVVLMLYAANLYAAYEVSIFRAQPVGLVCGISAVAPVLGPVIFLAMPTKLRPRQQDWQSAAEEVLEPGIAAAIAAEEAAPVEAGQEAGGAPAPPKPVLPPTKTFQRGQFTFNRRFFETQLAPFFAMTRPEAEMDKVLTFKTARGTYIARRISRISANDIQLQVQKGQASEDVTIPFVEIQEVELKHKDA